MGRVLGIDYGTRRIGLALSDELGWTARPLETVPAASWQRAVLRIQDIVRAEGVERIVLGSPKSLKGHAGTLSEEIDRFKKYLGKELGIPVLLWDERLSSVAAERILKEIGKKGKGEKDKMAATWVLQGYLDRLALEREKNGGDS